MLAKVLLFDNLSKTNFPELIIHKKELPVALYCFFTEICFSNILYQMKTVLRIITNKYMLAIVVFALLMLFFSPYDLFTIRESQKELDELNNKIEYMTLESDSMDTELQQLKTNPEVLEQYARESYHHKKDGEDVYVIVK
jgi:cell division protein FtsB